MREMLELQEAIERQRSLVNAMIEYGTDDENFIRENHKLDRLIEMYYIALEEVQKGRVLAYQED